MMNLLIASTSTVHGSSYLEYLESDIREFFSGSSKIVFIPFARPGGISWDEYTSIAQKAFSKMGLHLEGIHAGESMEDQLDSADGIFTGGGNTFVLLKQLYDSSIFDALRKKIKSDTPYMGTSAGSNILGVSIRTTNDMPIVYPPSFEALGAVPFSINPHYIDPDPSSKHMGETRETRIKEYLKFNDTYVVGLREGSFLHLHSGTFELKGPHSARVFHRNGTQEIDPSNSVEFLMT